LEEDEDEVVYLKIVLGMHIGINHDKESYSVGAAALRPTRARAAVMLGRCMISEVLESLSPCSMFCEDLSMIFPIYEGQKDLMYSSRINLNALYTYLCTYLLLNLNYPFTSRNQAAYQKPHRPPVKLVYDIPSRVCKKQWPGLAQLTTSLQTCIVWG
jgi:hypothetical protein